MRVYIWCDGSEPGGDATASLLRPAVAVVPWRCAASSLDPGPPDQQGADPVPSCQTWACSVGPGQLTHEDQDESRSASAVVLTFPPSRVVLLI